MKFRFLVNLICGNKFYSTQSDGDVTLLITVKLLDLTCNGSLYYKTRNSQQTEPSRINCLNGIRQQHEGRVRRTMNKNIKWNIGYLNYRTSNGDKKFWISITGDLLSFQTILIWIIQSWCIYFLHRRAIPVDLHKYKNSKGFE